MMNSVFVHVFWVPVVTTVHGASKNFSGSKHLIIFAANLQFEIEYLIMSNLFTIEIDAV